MLAICSALLARAIAFGPRQSGRWVGRVELGWSGRVGQVELLGWVPEWKHHREGTLKCFRLG